jgi:hypothetical protein
VRVRVDYAIDASDRYRRAINLHYGRPGLATRKQVRDWLIEYGSSADDSIVSEMDRADEEAAERADEEADE